MAKINGVFNIFGSGHKSESMFSEKNWIRPEKNKNWTNVYGMEMSLLRSL